MQLHPGVTIASRYRVLRELGRGGMGAVYVVEHVGTGDHLALKVMLGGAMSAEAIERFKREARAPAKIKSEHVVRVLDADTAPEIGGAPFLVMELLQGTDLQKLVKERGRFAPDEVVSLLAQVARALDKSHALGIVHRDLKPENLFLHRREDGGSIVKVLDFGISKVLSGGAMSALPMTQMGAVMGTPLYMAPEQARGAVHLVGPATDVWALGMIAVYLLAGEPYWARVPTPHGWVAPQSLTELIALLMQANLYPPSQRWPFLPPLFDAWLARACARDGSQRFPTAGHAVQELAMAMGVAVPSVPLSAEGDGTVTDPYGSTAATPSAEPRTSHPWVPPASALPPTAPVPYAPQGVPVMHSPAHGVTPPTLPMYGAPMHGEVVGGSTQGAVAHTLDYGAPSGPPVGKILAATFGVLAMFAGIGIFVWALLPSDKPSANAPPQPQPVQLAPAPTKEPENPLPELHHPAPLATVAPAAVGTLTTHAVDAGAAKASLPQAASPPATADVPPPTPSAKPPSTAKPPASAPTVDEGACKKACDTKCKSSRDRFACIRTCTFDECSGF